MAAAPADKTDALATRIAEKIAPQLTALIQAVAVLQTSNNQMLSQLTLMRQSTPQVSARRPPATGGRTGGSSGAATADPSKVKNCMNYFRYMLITSAEFRDHIYAHPETVGLTLERLHEIEATSNKAEGSIDWYSAIAKGIWRTFNEDMKKKYKIEFGSWKDEHSANAAQAPLATEGAAGSAYAAGDEGDDGEFPAGDSSLDDILNSLPTAF